jgi:hypothetical protein
MLKKSLKKRNVGIVIPKNNYSFSSLSPRTFVKIIVTMTTTTVTTIAAIVNPVAPSALSYKGNNQAFMASFYISAATKPNAAIINVKVCFLISITKFFI